MHWHADDCDDVELEESRDDYEKDNESDYDDESDDVDAPGLDAGPYVLPEY